MPNQFPSAALIRKQVPTLMDAEGRSYVRVSPNDMKKLSLPAGNLWYWCAKKKSGIPPRVGTRVGYMVVVLVACGFERTNSVGVVCLR